jgi:hypothetical protein
MLRESTDSVKRKTGRVHVDGLNPVSRGDGGVGVLATALDLGEVGGEPGCEVLEMRMVSGYGRLRTSRRGCNAGQFIYYIVSRSKAVRT